MKATVNSYSERTGLTQRLANHILNPEELSAKGSMVKSVLSFQALWPLKSSVFDCLKHFQVTRQILSLLNILFLLSSNPSRRRKEGSSCDNGGGGGGSSSVCVHNAK